MKMHHSLRAEHGGRVEDIRVKPGDIVAADDVVILLDPSDAGTTAAPAEQQIDLDEIRPDLAALFERRAKLLDENRPAGRRPSSRPWNAHRAREHRRPHRRRPAGRVRRLRGRRATRPAHDLRFGGSHARRRRHHRPRPGQRRRSSDRNARRAPSWPTTTPSCPAPRATSATARPTGSCNRPGGTAIPWCCSPRARADVPATPTRRTWPGCTTPRSPRWARCPVSCRLIGVVAGRCFAGNAALLGTCDVIIATADATIGMAGPVMIEGGGLGTFTPEQVGPDRRADPQRRRRHRGGRRGGGGCRREAVPGLLPGHAARLRSRRPASAAPPGAREPPARLRRARRRDTLFDVGFGPGIATRVRHLRHHRAGPHRGPIRRA